ncbi:sensor domain-containing diguanylate cyclase [Cytobacillus firmus]|uniref:Signal transduction diguanylate cyclase (GAF-GAF-GGDEF domains) n=1 Tax=Cytobacillus firmus DS1 TaxID=1307436 RepID=W7L5P1_CYTFI|nr:diguanylate cyclase [Cytobacillus firmus]EWG10552.1 signal transduction diguanylate cyclase (GAF-GAF-GGDEF domains) [Cytobacillus firmus DS1]
MDTLERQIILNLKSRFFDIIDTENGFFQYEQLLNEMLSAIKALTGADEITLYVFNVWKQEFFAEAATNPQDLDSSAFSHDLKRWAKKNRELKCLGAEIQGKQIMIPLVKRGKLLGCMILIGEFGSFHSYPGKVFQELSEECGQFFDKARGLAKIASQEKRYKQLYRVTEKFHSSMDMDMVLGEIIYTLQEMYPTFTYYLLLSQDNNNHGDLPIRDLEYDSENIAAMQAYVTGAVQFEDSLQEVRSILYAPLKGKQGVYGVLQVIAPNTMIFPKNEIEFITLLANTAGSALENAQLYQQSKRLIADLQLINETSHRLNSNLRLTETMNFMSEQILQSFDAEEAGFILISSDGSNVNIIQGSTEFFHTKEAESYIQYMKKKIIREKESLFIGDFSLQFEGAGCYKSIMAVPMTQSGVLKGFALVLHSSPYHFSFETFKLLQSLIHHSTLAFTNSMLREELEKMVVTDHLTKLYSRSYLDDRIHQSMNEDHEGTFMLVDIDDFKMVNDTYGHQVGDEIIIQVANLINSNIRGTDIGARWGGEELALYLPGVSLSAGALIAERLVRKVCQITDPKVTISCGVSYWSRGKKDSYAALFKRADKALYTAKNTGKNKVILESAADSFI